MRNPDFAIIKQLAMSFRSRQGVALLEKHKQADDRKSILGFEDRLKLARLEILLNLQLGIENKSIITDYLKLLKSQAASASSCAVTRSINFQLNNPETIFKENCEFLFISGLARSGTSALGRALSQCIKNTFITPERYPWDVGYSPFSFDPDYIFRVDAGYKLRPEYYQNTEQQFRQLFCDSPFCYLGDKRPRFLYSLEITKSLFSAASKAFTVIHIIRNPREVAASWQKRSDDPEDTWALWQNYEVMVKDSMCQTRIALNTKRHPSPGLNFVLCDYEVVFSDAEKLYNLFCMVVPENRVSEESCVRTVVESAPFIKHKKEIPEEIDSYFSSNPDAMNCFETLKQYC